MGVLHPRRTRSTRCCRNGSAWTNRGRRGLARDTGRRPGMADNPTRGRWNLVVAAVLVQLALGAVYAWSVFNKPLQDEFGWTKTQAVLPFEVAIGTIFIGSLIGGRIQ